MWKITSMLDLFKNPPAQYRLAPFWVWAEMPDPAEIDRQVREMYTKGIGGFFIDGQFAGPVDGSGEELLQRTQRACDAAQRLGLHIYQYEEPITSGKLPYILGTKLRTSATHTNGHIRSLGKSPDKSNEFVSLEELKQIIDQQACLGVNFFCPNAFHYSLVGQDSASQFYQSSPWRYYKHFANYAARLSYVLSQGRHTPQVALLRPGAYSDPLEPDTVDWLEAYCTCLLAEHVDFDILDENAIARATCADEQITVAEEEYELLILPPMAAVACKTAQKIRAFADEGGKLIGTMMLPAEDSAGDEHLEVRETLVSVFEDTGRTFFLEISRPADLPSMLKDVLRVAIKRNASIVRNGEECTDIACSHRSLDDVELFFLANTTDKAREVRISIRCDGAPHVLNLENGNTTALPNCTQTGNRTVLLHRFEKHSSLTIAFSNEPAFAVAPPMIEEGQEIALANEWEFIPEQPNCLTLHDWELNTLIQQGRNIIEYTTSFNSSFQPESLLVALEQAPVSGAMFINDQEAPAANGWVTDISLRTIDITSLVKPGKNVIRIECTSEESVPPKIRLMGSFSLDEAHACLLPPREFVQSGSWTDQGYPYYSGTAVYRQTASIPEFARGQRVILRAESPADLVEFVVNGVIAELRLWPPFEVDITALVTPGPNDIELRVTNGSANMFLSEPKPSGLINGAVAFLS